MDEEKERDTHCRHVTTPPPDSGKGAEGSAEIGWRGREAFGRDTPQRDATPPSLQHRTLPSEREGEERNCNQPLTVRLPSEQRVGATDDDIAIGKGPGPLQHVLAHQERRHMSR